MQQEKIQLNVIVELFGHNRIAGVLTEFVMGGAAKHVLIHQIDATFQCFNPV
jgi:hypothetical protein